MQSLRPSTTTMQDTGFGAVLCVTDGSPASTEAVRRAARLAGDGGRLDLLALAPDPPQGRPRPQAAQIEALVSATAVASRERVHANVQIAETSDGPATVAARARGHDLLVLPPGRLARAMVARAELPVLVARPGPQALDSVLVAVDGTAQAHAAALLGAELAARDDAQLALVATPEHDAAHQHALQRDAAAVERITGRRPLILDEHGPPVTSIVGAAATLKASLIVLGSRPEHHADSVSAQVAERATCSVLVLRGAAVRLSSQA
jgi:nucleotide-binding universal stress UspA family protein